METSHEKSLQTQELTDLISIFNYKDKKSFWKNLVKWFFVGIFMGTSDAIPGYSGGTTLILLGYFKKLILISKSVFIPEPGIKRRQALLFMMPFGISWLIGVFGFAKFTEFLSEKNMNLELIFFFGVFILCTIPVFLKGNNPHLLNRKKNIKNKKINWLFFITGFAIVIFLAIFTHLKGGIQFNKESNRDFNLNKEWFFLILVAYAAGLVTILPGGSGAIVQFLSGYYPKIHWTIMAHFHSNFLALFIFAISTFLGMLTMVFIMAWWLKKHHKILSAFSFGMLLASIISIFLIPNVRIWNEFYIWWHILSITLFSVLSFFVAFTINYQVYRKHKHKHKNKFKKL